MDLDYSEWGVVKVVIVKYQKKMIKKFTEEISGTSATPAADDQYKVSYEREDKMSSNLSSLNSSAFVHVYSSQAWYPNDHDIQNSKSEET